MATATTATGLVTFEQYDQMVFHPDREWIDGELRKRNVGKWEHARLQALLSALFIQNEEHWGVLAVVEQRVRVSPDRVRIPDVVLLQPGQHPPTIVEPPVLVVEILSRRDSYSDTQERASDYRSMGVKTIWIIDPKTRSGRMCLDNRISSPVIGNDIWIKNDVLVVPDTLIEVNLPHIFAKLMGGS